MKTLLVANRGEIAVRIVRSAHALGIRTVVVASEADRDSLAATVADEVVVIGPAAAPASYLDIDAVLGAADASGADAVHPGYGFLSENAEFARRVIASGRVWVGPAPDSIELMGDKARAIAAARTAHVPVLPGSDGVLGSDSDALAIARAIGYPLLVKASAGGGGRGIRLVREEEALLSSLATARAEAAASFGDDGVYLERFVDSARHVEVQILGDGRRAVHLGDRDCTMQRRSQKVLEEAPAPDLPGEVRERIARAAVSLAESTRYIGAGTVEFLYDPVSREAFFIEMNTRLQVEHPITEAITGIDLVQQQLRIADGETLGMEQQDVVFSGHAIECRINAEDPERGFFPSPGRIERMDWPAGARVDTGYASGSTVTPYYDSLVAKLIVHAPTRAEAITAMLDALDRTSIDGIATTLPLHRRLLATDAFAEATHTTTFVESVAVLETS